MDSHPPPTIEFPTPTGTPVRKRPTANKSDVSGVSPAVHVDEEIPLGGTNDTSADDTTTSADMDQLTEAYGKATLAEEHPAEPAFLVSEQRKEQQCEVQERNLLLSDEGPFAKYGNVLGEDSTATESQTKLTPKEKENRIPAGDTISISADQKELTEADQEKNEEEEEEVEPAFLLPEHTYPEQPCAGAIVKDAGILGENIPATKSENKEKESKIPLGESSSSSANCNNEAQLSEPLRKNNQEEIQAQQPAFLVPDENHFQQECEVQEGALVVPGEEEDEDGFVLIGEESDALLAESYDIVADTRKTQQ